MKNLLTFGLAVWLFLVPLGCAHTPDSSGSMPKHQEIATAQPAQPAQPPQASGTNGTPAVQLSETSFDFGVVSEGNDYLHAFKIRNTGTGVLEIKKIVPG
jgi:hypothetical protein